MSSRVKSPTNGTNPKADREPNTTERNIVLTFSQVPCVFWVFFEGWVAFEHRWLGPGFFLDPAWCHENCYATACLKNSSPSSSGQIEFFIIFQPPLLSKSVNKFFEITRQLLGLMGHNYSHQSTTKALIPWYLKHPFINGCFNWMIPNHYMKNCCFTKQPF